MTGIIVYYVIGPVHPRNLGLIAQEMPEWTFRLAYEPLLPWFRHGQLADLPFEKVALNHKQPPKSLWQGDVRAVLFSTVQPRQVAINLLQAALERNIPTISIEESNQIALNNGKVNNYLLPVDHLLVASHCEQQGMVDMGVPQHRLKISGWPFYSGKIGKVKPQQQQIMKKQLGLKANHPVAALTLTGFNTAGESAAVRRRQLTLATQGLPPDYQLVVKPHPIESLEILMPFIQECAPQATVIEGKVPIANLLEASDILLNRGASQVCFEALFQDIPVVVLETGATTPFHGVAQNLIVKQPADLTHIIKRLEAEKNPLDAYTAFKAQHIPYPPLEARQVTCDHIEKIAMGGNCASDRAGQWFNLALYQGWQVNQRLALKFLTPNLIPNADYPRDELKRLLQYQATRSDLERLKQAIGTGFQADTLRCLWIDQLYRRRETPTEADIDWMANFPPQLNIYLFTLHTARWTDVLIRTQQSQLVMTWGQRLSQDFAQVEPIARISQQITLYYSGGIGRAKYRLHRAKRELLASLEPLKPKVKQILFNLKLY